MNLRSAFQGLWPWRTRAATLPALAPTRAHVSQLAPCGSVLRLGYDAGGTVEVLLELRELPEDVAEVVTIDLLDAGGVMDSTRMALSLRREGGTAEVTLRYDAYRLRQLVGWQVAGISPSRGIWTCIANLAASPTARASTGAMKPPLYSLTSEEDGGPVFVTDRNKGVFHLLSCGHGRSARLNHLYENPQAALRAGYRPCLRCLPHAVR